MNQPPLPDKNHVARGALWAMANQSAGQILVLLVFLITARFVSKEAFGVMAACLLVIEGFRQIAIESVSLSIASRKSPGNADYNACFIIILTGSFLAGIVTFFLAGPIANIFNNPEIKPALQWVSLLLFTTGLSRTHETWLEKHLQFKKLTLRSLLSIGLGGGVGIYMAVHGYGIASLIVQQIVTSVTGTIFLWTTTQWKPSFDTKKEDVTGLLKYSRHVSASSALAFANGQSDILFSSYYLGAAATGVYNAAKRIVTAILLMIVSGLNKVALPSMADSHDRAESYLKWTHMTTFFLAPLYAGVAVLSHDIILLLLGEKWVEAAPVLSVLALVSYFTNMDRYNSNMFLVMDKPHWQTMITGAGALINIIALFIFARYGVLPLVLAFLGKVLLMYPVSVRASTKLLGISFLRQARTLLPSLTGAAVMSALLYAMKPFFTGLPVYASLPAQIIAGACIYFCAMALIDKKAFGEIVTAAKGVMTK